MSFKIGVIGCGGFAGYAHGPALAAYASHHPQVELAACCDLDPHRASAYAGEFGFSRTYTNLDAMLDREPLDGVLVLVAPIHTAAVATRVIQRGVPALLEKPPGLTLPDLDGLIGLADLHATPTQVAFNRRHMPLLRQARSILDTDFPRVMEIHYEIIRFDRRDTDFSTTAIHAIDAAHFLASQPFLTAEIQYPEPEVPGSESNATIFVKCESGPSIIIQIQPRAGLVSEAFRLHGLGASLVGQIFGPGSATAGGHLTHWKDDRLKFSYTDDHLPFVERHGIYGELSAFCRDVLDGTTPSPTLSDCRQQVSLMEALRHRVSQPIDFRKLALPACAA